jgi:hypothetical protein
MFSLGMAAKAAGVSKSTIHRAVASGRMSARSKGTAGYEIDPAELFRVFTPKSQEVAEPGSSGTISETIERSGTPASEPVGQLQARVARLEAELQAARSMAELEQRRSEQLVASERQRAEDARQRAEEFRQERDRWAGIAEANQRIIAAKPERPRGWWPFRRAGGAHC